MGGCDLGSGVDGLSGNLKDGRIRLDEKRERAAREGERHERRPGGRNEVVPIEVGCKLKILKRNHHSGTATRRDMLMY